MRDGNLNEDRLIYELADLLFQLLPVSRGEPVLDNPRDEREH